jgi:phosphatidylinositol alpha-mannosyltransferase
MLRVALVCPYSLSRPGGVQNQVLGLARNLTDRGHVVTVFAPVDGPPPSFDGVEVVAAGHSTSLRANGSVAPVSVSPAAGRRALAELRARRPDVVHIHEPFAPGLPYALLIAGDLPPMVGTFHRSGGSVLYALLGPVARRLAARMAVRCAVSDAAAATARAALGGTYEVLFNGIELDRFDGVVPYPTTGPTVLFLGRHERRKGLGVLLDAWQLLVDSAAVAGDPDRAPALWVAGDGPETSALRRRHPDSDTVRWLGVLDEEEKVRRLVGADVLAAPSLGGESFGLVLLEGMAARTVVVASDIDGYRDAAGGRAVLVPPGDSPALAGALRGVLDGTLAPASASALRGVLDGTLASASAFALDGPEDRGGWLEAGAERAASWSMASLAGRYEGLYRGVVVR